MTYTIDIRPRRQATLPSAVLAALGLSIGDSIQIKVEGNRAVLIPQKQIALDAFKEIQRIFSQSDITEKDMLESIDKQRMSRVQ